MTTQFATNFPIPSSTNVIAPLWKLTRAMKAAGWTYKASGAGTASGPKDSAGASDIWGTSGTPMTDAYTSTATTTNSGSVALPQATITVASTAGFPASGTISILTTVAGVPTWQNVTYTGGGGGGTTFTGCSGGTGNIVNGNPVASGASTISLDPCAAWIVLSGPQTLKIPLNAAPTGTPLRGETITQATTLAEGELLGYVWDTVGLTGWAAVLPRTGTFNMTTANTITGSTSGATMAPLTGGTMITYGREFMFYKDTTLTSGAIFYVCADIVGESAQLFSALAGAAGCTGVVGPGQGGTSNAFPTEGIIARGTQGSNTGTALFSNTSSFQTNAQIAATNVTPTTGVSADGTFYVTLTNSATANSCTGFAFLRLDDTEPGDCDPFVVLTSGQNNTYAAVTHTTAVTGSGATLYAFSYNNLKNNNFGYFLGNQSRGNGAADTFNVYTGMPQVDTIGGNAGGAAMSGPGLALPMRVVNSPATTKPLIIEPVAIYTLGLASVVNSKPQYKGRCRWLAFQTIGNTYDTFASKTFLGVSVATASAPCILIGPYDGATTPVQ